MSERFCGRGRPRTRGGHSCDVPYKRNPGAPARSERRALPNSALEPTTPYVVAYKRNLEPTTPYVVAYKRNLEPTTPHVVAYKRALKPTTP
jgi:hypothetical protein